MIKVLIQTHNQEYQAVFCEGHAMYADHGKDIVCAAVSVLLTNTANSIEQFSTSFAGAEAEDGTFSLVLKSPVDEKAALLIDSMILGLNSIQSEYGKNYLTIDIKEV